MNNITKSLYPIHKWCGWYIWRQPRIGYSDEWRAYKEEYGRRSVASTSLKLLFKEIRKVESTYGVDDISDPL